MQIYTFTLCWAYIYVGHDDVTVVFLWLSTHLFGASLCNTFLSLVEHTSIWETCVWQCPFLGEYTCISDIFIWQLPFFGWAHIHLGDLCVTVAFPWLNTHLVETYVCDSVHSLVEYTSIWDIFMWQLSSFGWTHIYFRHLYVTVAFSWLSEHLFVASFFESYFSYVSAVA